MCPCDICLVAMPLGCFMSSLSLRHSQRELFGAGEGSCYMHNFSASALIAPDGPVCGIQKFPRVSRGGDDDLNLI